MKLKCGIAIALLSSMPTLMADEFVPPSFSQGFEMLNALGPGLPDRNATWIKLNAHGRHQSNVLRELSTGMQGNTWLLPATDDENQMAIHFGNAAPRKTETGDDTPAGDLEKDIASIIEAISKVERVDDPENFRRPWSDGGSRTFGPLMVFAAQVHQAGHPKLADRLAWELFQAAPTREVVIDAALNHLGDELYNHATERFFENHDWQAYRAEITSLIERFPRGWDAQPAAILALEAINFRIENPNPPKPAFDGLTITAEAQAAVEWMTREPEADDSGPAVPPELAAMLAQIPPEYHADFLQHHGHAGASNTLANPGFWLLQPPLVASEHPSPAFDVLSLGLEAFPVLAALATDSYPTNFQNPGAARGGFSYSRSPATRALETHATMSRPATRGDIARMLLTPVLPDPQGRMRRADPHVIQDAAIDFYRTHKGKDIGELAAVYLGEGDDMQKTQAADFLAKSSEPRHHAIFENHVLNTPPATANLQAVITYSQQRKTEAKPFLDKYLPLIRDEIGDGSNVENDHTLHWQFRQPGQLNQTLRQLEAIAEGKSPVDSAREIAGGPPEEAAPAIQALLRNLASEPPDTHMEILLAGALAAEDARIRLSFLSPMLGLRNHFAGGNDDDDDDSQQTVPDEIREAWAVISEDDRTIETEWLTNAYFSADTIAEFAAMAFEARLNPGGIYELYQATGILRQPLAELCMARIKARMAGEPLAPLPDAENVSEERLREIVTEAGSKPASDIRPYLDSLTPDERAAWAEWMEDPDDIEVPESVRELAFTITDQETRVQEGLIPTPGLLNLTTGFTIHEDTIDAYIADLAKNHADHSLSMGTLNQSEIPPGLTAWTLRAEIPEEDEDTNRHDRMFMGGGFTPLDFFGQFIEYYMDDGMPDNAESLIVVQLYGDHAHLMFNWWVVDGKPAAFAIDNNGNMTDEVTNTLSETIGKIRQSSQLQTLLIQVLSREDAEKIANR